MPVLLSTLLPGLAAAGLTLSTSLLLHIPMSMPAAVVAFSGTSVVYVLDHSLPFSPEDRLNHPARVRWFKQHRLSIMLYSFMAGTVCVTGLFFLQPAARWLCLLIGFGSVLYLFPVMPGKKRLKSRPFAKPFYLAGLWAGGCVLLPAFESGYTALTPLSTILLYRLLYLMPNFMLNDRADRRGDEAYEIATLAVIVKDRTFHRLLYGILAAAFLTALLLMKSSVLLPVLDLAGLLFYVPLSRRLAFTSRARGNWALDAVACWPWLTVTAGLATGAVL